MHPKTSPEKHSPPWRQDVNNFIRHFKTSSLYKDKRINGIGRRLGPKDRGDKEPFITEIRKGTFEYPTLNAL